MQRTRNHIYILAASSALITFVVYLPALLNEFVYWDDDRYIFENPNIRSFDAAFLRWAFTTRLMGNWNPLTWISHAVDYALWGPNPVGHHLTSIILHALNTFLVVLLAARLLEIWRAENQVDSRFNIHNTKLHLQYSRFTLIAAGVVGLLFGIHPVHVESVAWAAERKDLLCALFFLLSIMQYLKYAQRQTAGAGRQEPEESKPDADNRGEKHRLLNINEHYLLALSFFILALMSKPMAVTLPAVLLILDWYPVGSIRSVKTFWAAMVTKLPFITLSLASSIMAIVAQKAENALLSFDNVSMPIRLLVAAKSLIAYLGKMLLPVDLVPLYPYPRGVSLFSIEYPAVLLLVAGITAVCVVLAKKQQVWLSAWGYYVLTLLPVLGIIQVGNQAMADRYIYLPSLGPFLVAGLCAARLTEKVYSEKREGMFVKAAAVAGAVLLVVVLAVQTIQQIAIWKNSLGLWTYVIEKEPERFPLAYNNRGMVFYQAGQFDKAIADFDKAVALDRQYAKAYFNRGSAFDRMGRLDKAIADYKTTLALDPLYYEAYYYLEQAVKKPGRPAKRGSVDQRSAQ